MGLHDIWACRVQCARHWLLGKWTCDSSITWHNTYCLAGVPCLHKCPFPSLTFFPLSSSLSDTNNMSCTSQWLCRRQNKFNSAYFSSFQFNSTHFILTESSRTQFSLLALHVLHPHSLIFSLPEPCNLLSFSHFFNSPSLFSNHRFVAPHHLFLPQVYAHATSLHLYLSVLPSLPFILPSVSFPGNTLLLHGPIFLPSKPSPKGHSTILQDRRWWERLGGLWGNSLKW